MKFDRDAQQHSPTMEHQNLHWNNTEYKLKFVLDNPNFQLPQIVKVLRGYMVDEDNLLASGQVLTLHGKKNVEQLVGYDSFGQVINIPLNCPHKVSLVSVGQPRRFANVSEVSFCENPPKFVTVEAELLTGDGSCYVANSRFQILDHGITANGVVVGISCREDKPCGSGDVIILPINLKCNFTETVSYESTREEHVLSDLVDMYGLPFQIQFQSTMGRSDSRYGPKLGVITLREKIQSNVVLSTTIIDDVRHALTFSADLPVTVQTATNLTYGKPKHMTSDDIDETTFDFLKSADPYSSAVIRSKEIKEAPRCLRSSSSVSSFHRNIRGGDFIPSHTPSVSRKSAPSHKPMIRRSFSPRTRSRTGSLDEIKEREENNKTRFGFKYLRRSFSKMTRRGKGSSKKHSSSSASTPEYDRASTRTSDFSDDGASIADTYSSHISESTRADEFRAIAQCIDSLTLDSQQSLPTTNQRLSRISSKDSGICLQRRKHNGSHSGYTVRTLSSNQSDDTSQNISEWNYPSKYDLSITTKSTSKSSNPGSYLWSADDNDDDITNNNNNKNNAKSQEYDLESTNCYTSTNIKTEHRSPSSDHRKQDILESPLMCSQVRSIEEIKLLNEDGVCTILDTLRLSDFKERFRNNQINGELLLDLEENELINELKFSLFQAKKITKYIKGWRPEPENLALKEQSRRNSLNPRDWSLNDVLLHLSTINLPDLGRFCKSNQVNGDLLLDILDKDCLQSLRNDHDVKISSIDAKKLKSFVVKGWRPDNSPKVSAK